MFNAELAMYPITELYKGYNHIVSKIEEIALNIVTEKENIDKKEMKRKYFEYVNNFQSVEFRYGYMNMVSFKHKIDKSLNRVLFYGNVLNIPISIKIYCLCLGISIN